MKPRARLKLTLACDKACRYCINHDEAYRKRWVTIDDVSTVDWTRYRTIVVSGGEPTLDMNLRSTLRSLRILAGDRPTIYLQTNGANLTKQLVMDPEVNHSIDGIGLSVHDYDEFRHLLPRWLDIAKVKPIRLYVSSEMVSELDLILRVRGIPTDLFQRRVWSDGVTDQSEDVYLMQNWEKNVRPT